MRCLAAITAGMLLVTNTAASDDKIVVAGVGANSCGKFIAETKDDETFRAAYFYWAQGFLSGLNYKYGLSPEFATDLADYNALMLWVDNYCEENPLDLYGVAAIKLWHELRIRQGLELDVQGILESILKDER